MFFAVDLFFFVLIFFHYYLYPSLVFINTIFICTIYSTCFVLALLFDTFLLLHYIRCVSTWKYFLLSIAFKNNIYYIYVIITYLCIYVVFNLLFTLYIIIYRKVLEETCLNMNIGFYLRFHHYRWSQLTFMTIWI